MKILFKTLILLAALTSLPAIAQQAQEFGDYIIHYPKSQRPTASVALTVAP
jgi:hypothetical protein